MILAFFFSAGLHAQHNKVVDALKKLKVDSLDEAKVLIDVASNNDTTKVLAHTWYYKGFIYFELYKRDKNIDGPERALAIDYFKNSSFKIEYSVELSPLGTGGALQFAQDKLEDQFILLNGDSYLDIDYQLESQSQV